MKLILNTIVAAFKPPKIKPIIVEKYSSEVLKNNRIYNRWGASDVGHGLIQWLNQKDGTIEEYEVSGDRI